MLMSTTKKMRELMPAGFLRLLSDRTGCANDPTLTTVIARERHTSKYWPAVLALAEETNPADFATWAIANPEKLPAKQAA
jgi:hypothetical protein